eukprot:Pompholyxophrys_punicea_v1_NODE_269_length_2443_cov_3.185930.p2 type:complete len:238 gc:universal NODE_269_length_2443_cov_3.185930:1388-675(-)
MIESWQRESSNQKKGIRFHPLLIRIALAIFTRSPSAYHVLNEFKILPLPSESTLKSYVKNFSTGAGVSESLPVLFQYRQRFDELMAENSVKNPTREIWVIFDELKVTAGIVWNARDGSIIGYQLSPQDMAELQDIYDRVKETDHILLFLCRSPVYTFQMIGPHFTSAGTMKSEFFKACLVETIAFYSFGFHATLAICDGGSSNLSCIKSLINVEKKLFALKILKLNPLLTILPEFQI